MEERSVKIICGPTAAGKSAIANMLGEKYGATIISADSRQIYKGFDVGTAKPPKDELARIKHYGIDVAEPTERYSAYKWATQAAGWIQASENPVIVGGTGFYIKSLVSPPYDEPPPSTIKWKPRYLIVDPGPPLAQHIARRVDEMLEAGWIEEVKSLMQTVPREAIAWKASGYRKIRDVIEGSLDINKAKELIVIETRQYAKRQRTWFRHQLGDANITHINPHDSNSISTVNSWWEC